MAMHGHPQVSSQLARLPVSSRRIIEGDTLMDFESRREPLSVALGHGLDYRLMGSGGQRLWGPHFTVLDSQHKSRPGR